METSTISWILQGLSAFVFLGAGVMKLAQTRKKVIASGGKWAQDFTDGAVKAIGAVEVLLAVGVVAPRLLGLSMAPEITALSGVGCALIMAGAFMTHLRRKEMPFLPVTLVVALIGLGAAWLNQPWF